MSDEHARRVVQKLKDWWTRPYWKYRRVSVGPKRTNGATLLLALFLAGIGAATIWMLLGALP